MCDEVISEDPFILKYCPDRYKARRMCDKAVDSYLLAVKFNPDWFVLSTMIEKLDSAVFSDKYVVFGDLESHFVTIFSRDVVFDSISLDNMIQKLLIVLDWWVGIINLNKAKHLKRNNKKLLLVAWDLTRWWEDARRWKKEIGSSFL